MAQEEEIERLKRALEQQTRRADEETRRADEETRRADEERLLREQEMRLRVHAEQNTRAIDAALQREREEHNKTTRGKPALPIPTNV